jgi:hypothetical protein
MADNIQVITGTQAAVAARLCNFPTGGAVPLPSHITWLKNRVRPLVVGNPTAWVDVIGYASRQWKHTGGANAHGLNRKLSADRCAAVKKEIGGYNPLVRFNIILPQGDSQALMPNPDDGYDRAVEVFVYTSAHPPGPTPTPTPPAPVLTHMKWSVSGYFSLMASVMYVAQFGIAFFKFRDDETGGVRNFISPMTGVGGGITILQIMKWFKELGNHNIPGWAQLEHAIEQVLKDPNLLNHPYEAIKKIGQAILTGASVSDWTDFTKCEVYLPLKFNLLDGKTIANASVTPGMYQTQRIWVYGPVWYEDASGKKMFGNHDLLSADAAGWQAQVPGLSGGFVGGPLLLL